MSLIKGTKDVAVLTKIPAVLQEKDIVIKENGTTTVVPDDKYEGINKVIINTQVEGGSGSKNGYTAATVAEMKAITDASVDDKCVVLKSSIAKMTSTTTTQYITFPETVTLDEAVTDYISGRLESSSGNMADIMLAKSRFRFMMFGSSSEISVRYDSTDGINYTLSSSITNPVDLGEEMTVYSSEWNDILGNFMLVGSTDFGGIYNYSGTDWETQSIGLNISNDKVVSGVRYYDNGFMEGTLGNVSTKEGVQNLNLFLDSYGKKVVWPENMGSYFNNYKGETVPLLELNPDTSNVTNMQSMFAYCPSLKTIPLFDTSNVTFIYGMFAGCSSLVSIPKLDTSKVTSLNDTFRECGSLTTIPALDTSNVTSMHSTFYMCFKMTAIPLLDTSKVTDMYTAFYYCNSLLSIPALDTSNVTNMYAMFRFAAKIQTIPFLKMEKVVDIRGMFIGCGSLTNLGGFGNLGMGYNTSASANYSYYEMSLSECKGLTHDSLMNVINNLYDIKTAGVKAQKLTIGSTNLAKLTSEEIAIATNKGWNVS